MVIKFASFHDAISPIRHGLLHDEPHTSATLDPSSSDLDDCLPQISPPKRRQFVFRHVPKVAATADFFSDRSGGEVIVDRIVSTDFDTAQLTDRTSGITAAASTTLCVRRDEKSHPSSRHGSDDIAVSSNSFADNLPTSDARFSSTNNAGANEKSSTSSDHCTGQLSMSTDRKADHCVSSDDDEDYQMLDRNFTSEDICEENRSADSYPPASDSQSSQSSSIKSDENELKRRRPLDKGAAAELKRAKLEAKMERASAREVARCAKEFERTKKQALAAARRQVQPGECMKFVTAMIDPSVLKSPGGATVLDALQKIDVKYEIQPQVEPGIITFFREVTEVVEGQTNIETKTHEVVEDEVLLVLSEAQLINLVHASLQIGQGIDNPPAVETLSSLVHRLHALLGKKVTLISHSLEKYFRMKKTERSRHHREAVLTGNADMMSWKQNSADRTHISKLDVQQASLELQMRHNCMLRILSSDSDLGKTVAQYTRAIAEAPYKREKLQTGMTFHVEKKGCVRLEKDGRGLPQLWRQQIQQFKNVGTEMVNAIIALYPSPAHLIQAYHGQTESEGECLLQDIVVRRGAGVLATSRRIGKELSRRIYQLMTATDPLFVLK